MSDEPLLYSIPQAMIKLNLGRSTLYELTGKGIIRTVKLGRRTLIAHDELERFVRQLGA